MTKKQEFRNTINLCMKKNKSLYMEILASINYIGVQVIAHHIERETYDSEEMEAVLKFYEAYNEDLVLVEGKNRYEIINFYALV